MSAYISPTCGYCENPPVATCDGACQKPICAVHRTATWPSPDGVSRLDYCDCCLTAANAPSPVTAQPFDAEPVPDEPMSEPTSPEIAP